MVAVAVVVGAATIRAVGRVPVDRVVIARAVVRKARDRAVRVPAAVLPRDVPVDGIASCLVAALRLF